MLLKSEEFLNHFKVMQENEVAPFGNEFRTASSNAEKALKEIKENLEPFDSRNSTEAQKRFLRIERAFSGYVNSVRLHSEGVHAESTRKPFVGRITEEVSRLEYHLNSRE